jgi:hypothetical protein
MTPGYNDIMGGSGITNNGSYVDPNFGTVPPNYPAMTPPQGPSLSDTLQNPMGTANGPNNTFQVTAQTNPLGIGGTNNGTAPLGQMQPVTAQNNPFVMNSTSTPPPQGQSNLATGQQLMFNPMNALPPMPQQPVAPQILPGTFNPGFAKTTQSAPSPQTVPRATGPVRPRQAQTQPMRTAPIRVR